MRIVVRSLLPLGEGTVLDPFMGSGSTIAAAEAVGYASLGVELDAEYFRLAGKAIPCLAALYPDFTGQELEMVTEYASAAVSDEKQMALALAERHSPSGSNNRASRRVLPGRRK